MTTKHVLIADDDSDFTYLIAQRLRTLGLEVLRSPDAMHALIGAHRTKPDLIILDVNMPNGNGLTVCEMMRGDGELAGVPVIIASGESDSHMAERANVLGARFVHKGPSFWDRLWPIVCELLDVPPPTEVEPELEPVPREEPPADSPPLQYKVLCIDDDPEFSKIIQARLLPYGVDVLRSFNGTQGYWTAIDMRPDVVITDMYMPQGEGNYVVGRLMSHPLTKDLPIIVITGKNHAALRRQMLSLGVQAFLEKPLVFKDLKRELRRHIPLERTAEMATSS